MILDAPNGVALKRMIIPEIRRNERTETARAKMPRTEHFSDRTIIGLGSVNNCADREENDNGGNACGGWGYHQYQVGRHLAQICNTDQDSPIEIEWADLDDWHTDSEISR